ncbi:hypothetical protein RRG08_035239 [Elysia crispata]|uniref:Uncharacterized protein n=1 Tax=Elysia crispata TaxID=231223 RepID=A0AAE1DIQ4_9GAST|nr:hypothetical protein RRG08_035239 [Elysia crispata]
MDPSALSWPSEEDTRALSNISRNSFTTGSFWEPLIAPRRSPTVRTTRDGDGEFSRGPDAGVSLFPGSLRYSFRSNHLCDLHETKEILTDLVVEANTTGDKIACRGSRQWL